VNSSLLPYIGDVLLSAGWFAYAWFGGKKEYHEDVISQLNTLVGAQQLEIALLKEQNMRQQETLDRSQERIAYLEEIIGDDPDLVRARIIARQQRTARRGRSAYPPSTGNGAV
jgi:hypothetical protein